MTHHTDGSLKYRVRNFAEEFKEVYQKVLMPLALLLLIVSFSFLVFRFSLDRFSNIDNTKMLLFDIKMELESIRESVENAK